MQNVKLQSKHLHMLKKKTLMYNRLISTSLKPLLIGMFFFSIESGVQTNMGVMDNPEADITGLD